MAGIAHAETIGRRAGASAPAGVVQATLCRRATVLFLMPCIDQRRGALRNAVQNDNGLKTCCNLPT
jgi:hypothetical protein